MMISKSFHKRSICLNIGVTIRPTNVSDEWPYGGFFVHLFVKFPLTGHSLSAVHLRIQISDPLTLLGFIYTPVLDKLFKISIFAINFRDPITY